MISSFSTAVSPLQRPLCGNEIEANYWEATTHRLRSDIRQRLLKSKSLHCLAIHASPNSEAIVLCSLLTVSEPPASERVLSAETANDIFLKCCSTVDQLGLVSQTSKVNWGAT